MTLTRRASIRICLILAIACLPVTEQIASAGGTSATEAPHFEGEPMRLPAHKEILPGHPEVVPDKPRPPGKSEAIDSRSQYQLGTLYEQQGKPAEAIAAYREALRLDPEDTRSLERMIMIYGARKDWPNAVDCAEHWQEIEPDSPQARFVKGWFEFAGGELRESAEDLEEALKSCPGSPEVNNAYGLVLAELGKQDRAEKTYRQVLDRFPDFLPSRLNLAMLFLTSGHAPAAADFMQQLPAEASEMPPVLAANALIAAVSGRTEIAESLAKQALSFNERDAIARLTLSLVLKAKGDEPGRLSELRRALAAEPSSVLIMNEMARACLDQQLFSEAAKTAQAALQLSPTNQASKQILASSLSRMGNWDGAVLFLQEAAARSPGDSKLRCELALAQERKGDLDGADISYRLALKANAQELAAYLGCARIALRRNERDDAQMMAERATTLAPTSIEAHLLLADALYRKGKLDLSLEECRYVSSLEPGNRQALCLMGKILFHKGDWLGSAACLQKWAGDRNGSADDFLMLALAQERLHDRDSALATLKLAAADFPSDSRINEALARLNKTPHRRQHLKQQQSGQHSGTVQLR